MGKSNRIDYQGESHSMHPYPNRFSRQWNFSKPSDVLILAHEIANSTTHEEEM